ncbi:DUF7577 domain-containing protein [Halosegnis longus]|uniref:DUF7577 domain-containing protein n=2 Tax=Halosegnis longus TaxID=2216012 RepID=UPI0013564A53|nr:zinc ribbon domain-containing protein [Salella cibi]
MGCHLTARFNTEAVWPPNMSSDSVECPRCGEQFDLWASGGYCTNPDCGAQHPQAKSDSDGDDGNTGGSTTESTDSGDDTGSDSSLVECSNCGSEVDASFDFCGECGSELTVDDDDDDDDDGGDPGTVQCPGCGTESSTEFEYCSNCGTELPDTGTDTSDDTPPGDDVDDTTPVPDDGDPDVEIEVAGERMSIAHGDIVGGEVREALVRDGTDRDEARYIHREHIEFEMRDDGVYVVDHGRNTTEVDGQSLTEGDETKVSDGSSIELSGIAKLDVHIT